MITNDKLRDEFEEWTATFFENQNPSFEFAVKELMWEAAQEFHQRAVRKAIDAVDRIF